MKNKGQNGILTDQKYANRPWVKWYKNKNWFRLRHWRLSQEPLCRYCKRMGIVKPGDTVDHIIPHKGNMDLFFDKMNTQTLCKSCHSSTKQKIEKSGDFGCDVDGNVPGWK